ncbi:hypothetical protein PPERSA_05498 [Pseudocohnilembus persalinus]|uniref:Uncharacterized protein n=1 Tax=Pseudocohnilembus persalinus TaxID=266149 RepID=A0A0V0QCY5_PSEPJ|nr:hypothetical protein PPERSA_05498 [Pseudocohnilembus persalinus]|eukprot:KRW99995.1 hypothetical protein PPERSA_05498 [Pseudocohnilembus persalinus]
MGNSQTTNEPDFPINKYLRDGLRREEVIGLWNVFESFGPQKGVIQVSQLKKRYQDSYDKTTFDQKLKNMETLDFDQFFQVMSEDIIDKKKKYGDVDFDYNPHENAQCIFCPSFQGNQQQN